MSGHAAINDDLFRPPDKIGEWMPQPLPGELLRDYLIRMILEEEGMASFFEWCCQ